MVTDEFCAWAAERLLAQLRSGDLPEPTPGHFAWDPLLYAIRTSVAPDDLPLVRQLVTDHRSVMWGALLSRRFPDDDGLTDVLLAAFVDESDVERKIGLLHHLSSRVLSDDQHNVLFGWVQTNATDLIDEQRSKFSDATGPERLHLRLTSDDPAFALKRWLYMYSAHSLGPAGARAVLEAHRNDSDPRVVAATQHSLALLG